MKYKSNKHVVYSCKYHVVWCSKYRRPVLTGAVEKWLRNLVLDTAGERRAEVIEWEVMPDHVHLRLEVDPQYGIHRLVRQLKGRSSHVLRREFPSLASRLPTLWTNSYFLSTAGGSPLAGIQRYIEKQKRSER